MAAAEAKEAVSSKAADLQASAQETAAGVQASAQDAAADVQASAQEASAQGAGASSGGGMIDSIKEAAAVSRAGVHWEGGGAACLPRLAASLTHSTLPAHSITAAFNAAEHGRHAEAGQPSDARHARGPLLKRMQPVEAQRGSICCCEGGCSFWSWCCARLLACLRACLAWLVNCVAMQ